MTALSAWMKPHLSSATFKLKQKLQLASEEYQSACKAVEDNYNLQQKIKAAFINLDTITVNFELDGVTYPLVLNTAVSARGLEFPTLVAFPLNATKDKILEGINKTAQQITQSWYADACVKKLTEEEKQQLKQNILDLI